MRTKLIALTMCLSCLFLSGCASSTPDLPVGYQWESLEQTGRDDAIYCNASQNLHSQNNLLLFCHDPIYDITYYVNYGDDFYIYAYKDGTSKPVVKLPASRLFCREGILYFTANTYDENEIYPQQQSSCGSIMQYDPLTGAVTTVIEEQAASMIVYQDGIYYYTEGERISVGNDYSGVSKTFKFYSFAEETIIELPKTNYLYRSLYRVGPNFLFYVAEPYQGDDEYMLELAKTQEVTVVTGMKMGDINLDDEIFLDNLVVTYNFSVEAQNICYTSNEDSFCEFVVYDTEAKTDSRYRLSFPVYGAFVLRDNTVYFSEKMSLDLNTGKESRISSEDFFSIQELYTDGENLYGLCTNPLAESRNTRFYRIDIQDGTARFSLLSE